MLTTPKQKPKNAIGFFGMADNWSPSEEVLPLAKELDIPMYLYEGANHSLETGDTLTFSEKPAMLLNGRITSPAPFRYMT